MSKAVGWTLIIVLVLLLGTHPTVLVGLLQHAYTVLRSAGNELSSFASKL